MKSRQFIQNCGCAFIGSTLLDFSSGNATSNTLTIKLNASMGGINFDNRVENTGLSI
jgi:hypothetical protein